MADTVATVQTLRRCLSQDRSPAAVAALGHALDATDWKGLVDLANRYFLTRALRWAWRTRDWPAACRGRLAVWPVLGARD